MSNDDVAVAVRRAFAYKTLQVRNHTGMCVQLMQSAAPGAHTGGACATSSSLGLLCAEPDLELVLAAPKPLRSIPLERGVTTYCVEQKRPWCKILCSQISTSTPILVRPEVGMALACGAVQDTRLLDDVVVMVPLEYDVRSTNDDEAVLVVRSVYTWTNECTNRKRARPDALP